MTYGPRNNTNERFWSKVNRNSSKGCWPWMASLTRSGYGNFWLDDRLVNASRVAWIMARGRIPNGIIVCHTCDNRRCCRPDHLSLGTHGDNARDRELKGRSSHATGDRHGTHTRPESLNRGQAHKHAKLTRDIGAIILARYRTERVSQEQLAEEYGVSQATISRIILGQSWHTAR